METSSKLMSLNTNFISVVQKVKFLQLPKKILFFKCLFWHFYLLINQIKCISIHKSISILILQLDILNQEFFDKVAIYIFKNT